MSPDRPRQHGFTLIEVMVALVIVALGMIAVNQQLGRFAVTAIHMEEKTLASWIASNRIVELSTASSWPELGNDEEEIEFAGRLWICSWEVTETELENLRRVDVTVAFADAPDAVLHRMMGLLEPPAPRGFAPVNWLPPAVEAGQ